MNKKDIECIIQSGVAAPSGDNSQPWRFVVLGSTLNVYNIPGSDLECYNFDQKGSLLAHGAMVENMMIAARQLGYESEFVLFPQGTDSNLTCRLTFSESVSDGDSLFDAISVRATNRKPYTPETLPPDIMRVLEHTITTLPKEVKCTIVTDADKKSHIATYSSVNEKIVLGTQSIHDPFFEHVVWSEEEERKKRTGLYVDTLELPPPGRFIFKLASNWNIMKLFNVIGLSKKVAQENATVYKTCPAMLVFSNKQDTPEGFFFMGIAMQRMWLSLVTRGWSAHPVTGVLYLHQSVSRDKASFLKKEQCMSVMDAYKKIQQTAGLEDSDTIGMILRIGDGGTPSARSSRKQPDIEYKKI